MKRYTLSLILLLSLCATARSQFALEHTYPNAAYIASPNQMYMVELESLGQRYVFFDKVAKTVTLFDLDHTQTQVIDLSAVTDDGISGSRQILYISQYLFDLDDGIELMYFSSTGPGISAVMTSIVDESGVVIQSFPNEAPYCVANYPQVHFPIYQTPDGAKMILSHQVNMEARVYGLPGSLTVGMSPSGETPIQNGEVKIYPNPATSTFNVELQGIDISNDLVIKLYSIDGKLVLQRKIESGSTSIDRGSLGAGQYLYSIARNGIALNSGSVILE